MALVQFRNQAAGIEITKKLASPKKHTLEAWYKACRKVVPEIPDINNTDWIISREHADLTWIVFEFVNSIGEKCKVVINRTIPFLGV